MTHYCFFFFKQHTTSHLSLLGASEKLQHIIVSASSLARERRFQIKDTKTSLNGMTHDLKIFHTAQI